MQEISFSNRLFNEISIYALRFATPVFFGESPYASYAASMRNGTATLLKLEDRFVGVTCQHVLEEYRQLRSVKPTIFQLGPVQIDLEKYLINEDRNWDLAILDLTSFVGEVPKFTEANFICPAVWPPKDVSKHDILCLAGFPGIWREQKDLGYFRFYSFSSGTVEVLSVCDEKIVTTIQIKDCITQINNGKVLGSLGGLSGGPVLAWRKTPILVAELVGFIYEYQESLDLLFVRAAKVIRKDGTFI